ncbi:MAG: ABC transporter ATP-binding protein [Planctomycetaceae bacterium]|nr:ABC transporter ATP-binding protein [Planctomycetaceae bacterium]
MRAPSPGEAPSSPAVETRALTRVFDGKVAVDALDLVVPRGVFFGFLGPNGAGKSTTIRMLCGMMTPTSGAARVLGIDPAADPEGVKRVLGILPEEIHTYERLSGWEILVFTGRMHALGIEESERRAADLLALMEVNEEDRHRLLVDYSMGTKKKVLLACAMIHSPRVLFLDEPFNGIDAVTARAIRRVLERAVERGVTVFFSSHVMETVERLCDLAAVIHRGRLVASGTVDDLRAAAGLGPGSPLEDVFVRLVGGVEDRGALEWLA